jgi:hypothetical protein
LTRPVVDWVRGTLVPTLQNLWDRFEAGSQRIGVAWSVLWRAVRMLWDRYGQPIFDAVGSAIDWAGERIEELVGWVRGLPGRILGALGRNLRGLLPQAGRDIIQGLWNGMSQRFSSVRTWVSGLGSILQRLKGPLSVDRTLLTEQGRAIMRGFHGGLSDEWSRVEQFLNERNAQIGGAFAPAFAGTGQVNINGNVTVGSRDDLDEVRFAVRKMALEIN